MKRADKRDPLDSSILQAEHQVLLGDERRKAAFREMSASTSRVATTAAKSALGVVGLLAVIWVLPRLLQNLGKRSSHPVGPTTRSHGAVARLPAMLQNVTSPLLRPAITSLVMNVAHKPFAGWRGRSGADGARQSVRDRRSAAIAPAPSGRGDRSS
jgi:hypothetical protein